MWRDGRAMRATCQPAILPAQRQGDERTDLQDRGHSHQLPAPPSGQQTFQDVPPTPHSGSGSRPGHGRHNRGYHVVARESRVCRPNSPYFRPNADVTRGQAAKIVSNTFFPNCQSQDR